MFYYIKQKLIFIKIIKFKVKDNSETNDINVLFTDVHKELPELYINLSFIEWFIGLCDAEANFLIRTRKNDKKEVSGF